MASTDYKVTIPAAELMLNPSAGESRLAVRKRKRESKSGMRKRKPESLFTKQEHGCNGCGGGEWQVFCHHLRRHAVVDQGTSFCYVVAV